MYTVTKRNAIEEELTIQNLKGEAELTLCVSLHVDDILAQYNRLRRILGEAQENLSKDPTSEEALTGYGAAVVAFFELIFGADGCQKLLDYYKGRYGDMLSDVAPFVVDVIQPQVNKAMKERAARYKAIAKSAKK